MRQLRCHVMVSAVLACILSLMTTTGVAQGRVCREIRRFDVPEARQGGTVDAELQSSGMQDVPSKTSSGLRS
ncbi:MAG: hypothetical protein AB7U20_06655 [Planctomycetaceae bacterium]